MIVRHRLRYLTGELVQSIVKLTLKGNGIEKLPGEATAPTLMTLIRVFTTLGKVRAEMVKYVTFDLLANLCSVR